jgi:hypothetical protein
VAGSAPVCGRLAYACAAAGVMPARTRLRRRGETLQLALKDRDLVAHSDHSGGDQGRRHCRHPQDRLGAGPRGFVPLVRWEGTMCPWV